MLHNVRTEDIETDTEIMVGFICETCKYRTMNGREFVEHIAEPVTDTEPEPAPEEEPEPAPIEVPEAGEETWNEDSPRFGQLSLNAGFKDLQIKVVSVEKKETREGRTYLAAIVSDRVDTKLPFFVWDEEHMSLIKEGAMLVIDGYFKDYKGSAQLGLGKFGKVRTHITDWQQELV